MQPAEHLGFGVGLPDVDLEIGLLAGLDAQVNQFRVRRTAIDHGLAGAEATQVRTIEDVDLHEETSR